MRGTNTEWDALCKHVTDCMTIFTSPYATPIVHEKDDKEPIFGSGTYIHFTEPSTLDVHLLTCEHVASCQPLTHKPRGNSSLIELTGNAISSPYPKDVALIPISSDDWNNKRCEAKSLPNEVIHDSGSFVEDEILFFFGASGENSYAGFGGHDAINTGYCTQGKRDSGNDDIIELFWEPGNIRMTDNINPETAKRVKFNDPAGFSGSLVWNTRFVELGCDKSSWSPEHARVAGLVQRWDTTTQTVIVWRLRHLQDWLCSLNK